MSNRVFNGRIVDAMVVLAMELEYISIEHLGHSALGTRVGNGHVLLDHI